MRPLRLACSPDFTVGQGEVEEGREAGLRLIGRLPAPIPRIGISPLQNVARTIAEELPRFLQIMPPRKLTVDHMRGVAQLFRQLADELEEQAAAATRVPHSGAQ